MPDLSIAINLSPQQLIHQRLVEAVAKSLSDTALDPGCIELEIGDGDVVRKRSAELETLRGLRKLGVRLSLDHFGTRDVSFESLDNGFIDSFVLDQSLIADVEENDSHQRIVRAAIAMAQGLDMEGRLAERMARLDARIEATYRQGEAVELSERDYENFFRYLGGLRGLSESGIGFIRVAETVDWVHWREARF